MAVMLGAFAMAIVWIALAYPLASARARTRHTSEPAVTSRPLGLAANLPGLELLYTVPLTAESVTVRVAGSEGVCPLGLKLGDRVQVDTGGRLSPPICRTAVEALEPLLAVQPGARDVSALAQCRCPLAGQRLTFDVRPAVGAGLS